MSDLEVEALLIEADKRTRLVKGDEFDEVSSDLMNRLKILEEGMKNLEHEINNLKAWKSRQV